MSNNQWKVRMVVLTALVMSISLPYAWSLEAVLDCKFIERPQTIGQENDRPKRKVIIKKLQTAPVIDGDLNDAAWQNAAILDGFERGRLGAKRRADQLNVKGNQAELLAKELKPGAGTETKGYVFYTDTHLYFGFECFEPQIAKILVNDAAKRDYAVWNDDDLEIYLNPGNDSINIYQFGVNPAAVIYDGYNRRDPPTGKITEDRNWNCDIRAVAKRTDKSWTVEMAVPLSAIIKSDPTGLVFGFNVQRQRRGGVRNEGDDLQFWAPSDESAYAEPLHYGLLIFGREPETEVLSFGIANPKYGKNLLLARARNQGDQNVDLDCEAEFTSGKSQPVKVQGKINCPARKESKAEFPCELTPTGQWLFKGTIKQGDRIIANRQESFSTGKELIEVRLADCRYYTDDKSAKAALNLNIAPASLQEMQLEVVVKNEKDVIRQSKIKDIRSEEVQLNINLSDLAAGIYQLQCNLRDRQDKIIASSTNKIVITVAGQKQAEAIWPMYRGNPQRTGYSPFKGPEKLTVKWATDLTNEVYASPAVGPDGTIYVGAGKVLYALSPEDGRILWLYQYKGRESSGGFLSATPAISRDNILFQTTGDGRLGQVSALRADLQAEERVLWETNWFGGMHSSALLLPDKTLYVGCEAENNLLALKADGEFLWGKPVWKQYGTTVSPAASLDGKVIYIGGFERYFYAISREDGRVIWKVKAGGYMPEAPAIGKNGTIYFGAWEWPEDIKPGEHGEIKLDGKLYAVSPNGQIQWELALGDRVTSAPALAPDGTIVVNTFEGKLYAIREEQGKPKIAWAVDAKVRYSSPLISSDGKVYVGAMDGKLRVYNLADGKALGEVEIGNWVYGSPVPGGDGIIYIGSCDGKLRAIE